jgi:DNA-binding transcriptional ArsR family regulator
MGTSSEQIAHPGRDQLELGSVLHALSDPVRLQIVAELARGEVECTCGSFELPVTKSTCTHHFKVLREAGVIKQRQQGTTRLNALRRTDLDARFPGLLDTILHAARTSAGGAEEAAASLTAVAGTVGTSSIRAA